MSDSSTTVARRGRHAAGPPLVHVENVSRTYASAAGEVHALNDVSFVIPMVFTVRYAAYIKAKGEALMAAMAQNGPAGHPAAPGYPAVPGYPAAPGHPAPGYPGRDYPARDYPGRDY